jgi:hypothetical protein
MCRAGAAAQRRIPPLVMRNMFASSMMLIRRCCSGRPWRPDSRERRIRFASPALRAAFGVRVCNPANTVTKRYLGPVAFESRRVARKSLGPGFRQDDGNRIDQRV